MNIRINNLAAKTSGMIRRQPFVTLSLTSVVAIAAGVGVWAYTVHVAQIRTEKMVRTEAATLNSLVAKLNAVDSRMQRQSQTLLAKVESLRQANAMVAAYALRVGTSGTGIGRRGRLTSAALGNNPFGFQHQWTAQVCGNLGLGAQLQEQLQVNVKGDATGEVAAEALHNGVWGALKGNGIVQVGASDAPSISIGAQVCYNVQLPQGNGLVFQDSRTIQQKSIQPVSLVSAVNNAGRLGNFPGRGAQPQADPPNLAARVGQPGSGFGATLINTAQQVKVQLSAFLRKHPRVITALPQTIHALGNLQMNVSRQSVIAAVQDPKELFSSVRGLMQALPIPGNLSQVVQDPTVFLPKLGDLKPSNLCYNAVASGNTGIIANVCAQVPPNLSSLPRVDNFIGQAANFASNLNDLSAKVQNVQTYVADTCSSLNTFANPVDVGPANIGTYSIPNGVYLGNFGVPYLSYASDTFNVPRIQVLPALLPAPLPCSSL